MSLTHKWNRTAYPICNGVKYNNRYIFNMITLDEFLKSNNPTEHVNIVVNKQVNPKFSKDIANKLNRPITFFCIDKIGYSIIRLIS